MLKNPNLHLSRHYETTPCSAVCLKSSPKPTSIRLQLRGYDPVKHRGLQDQGLMGNWGLGELRPLLTFIKV
jgi:hypothetical protein